MMGSSALLHGSDKQPIWLCGDGGSGTKEEFAGIVLEVGLGDSLLNMPAARIVMLDDYRDDESAYDHLIKAYEIDSRRNRNKHPATVINFMFRPVDTESDNEIELGDIHGVPLLTGSPKLLGPALEQLNEQFSVSTTDIDMKKIVTAIAD
jgi:hypothetical protein